MLLLTEIKSPSNMKIIPNKKNKKINNTETVNQTNVIGEINTEINIQDLHSEKLYIVYLKQKIN